MLDERLLETKLGRLRARVAAEDIVLSDFDTWGGSGPRTNVMELFG